MKPTPAARPVQHDAEDHDDDHDLGLSHDLATLVSRRRALGLLSALGAPALLVGCGDGDRANAEVVAQAPDGSECVATPAETAGPYPADGSNRAHGELANVLSESGVIRSDIRPSFAGLTGDAEGVRLDLTVRLVDVSQRCAPLADHAFYLWHCDAVGRYSLYNVADANFLRGVGVSDADGVLRFVTIVPGCYPGRFPHIHFEVYPSLAAASDYRNRILTSQMAMPQAMNEAVYAGDARYGRSAENLPRATLERDGVFRDNTARELAAQTPRVTGDPASGYRGEVVIGLMA